MKITEGNICPSCGLRTIYAISKLVNKTACQNPKCLAQFLVKDGVIIPVEVAKG